MPPSLNRRYVIGPLTGGLNTESEDGGLISFASNNMPTGIEFREQENWSILRRGGLSIAQGFERIATLPGRITGLHEFVRSNGVKTNLATQGNTLYSFTDTGYTAVATGIESNFYTQMTTAKDVTVICDGANKPWVWDGTSLTALGGNPPTGARASFFYQNRLWVFSTTNNTSLVYYSDPDDITTGYSSQFVNCNNNDGEKITALSAYFIPGSLEPILIVGKERSVGIITGTGAADDPYTYVKVNRETGIPGFRQIVQPDQDIAYLTRRGVSSYKTNTYSGDFTFYYLSDKLRSEFVALDQSEIINALAWNDWKNRRICFACPEAGETSNNVIFCYDIELKSWYKERYDEDVTAVMVTSEGVVYHGTTSGHINKHTGVSSFAGAPIPAILRTDHIDFGDSTRKKRIVELRIRTRGNGAYPYKVKLTYDYGNTVGPQYEILMQTAPYVWGSGVWSADPGVYQWGGARIENRKLFPSGWFETVQIEITRTDTSTLLFDDPEGFFDAYPGLFDSVSGNGVNQPIDLYEIEAVVQFGGLR